MLRPLTQVTHADATNLHDVCYGVLSGSNAEQFEMSEMAEKQTLNIIQLQTDADCELNNTEGQEHTFSKWCYSFLIPTEFNPEERQCVPYG